MVDLLYIPSASSRFLHRKLSEKMELLRIKIEKAVRLRAAQTVDKMVPGAMHPEPF